MSKYVKNLITQDLAQRLSGVDDALLVNVVGIDANQTVVLRRELREKNIQMMVVKNSLARRATEGTPLAAAFQGAEGTLAIVWGSEDIISLAKEVTRLDKSKDYEHFKARGGVMDGEHLTADRVRDMSTWPNRTGQLSIVSGQMLAPGALLLSQIGGPSGALASQIEKKSEEKE